MVLLLLRFVSEVLPPLFGLVAWLGFIGCEEYVPHTDEMQPTADYDHGGEERLNQASLGVLV